MTPHRALAARAAVALATAVFATAAWGQKAADPPNSIAPDAVRKVKQATVMLKVTSEGGRTAEGSGFFAVEPGLVVTNAHVLGMLQANSKAPTKVEVTVASGTANEFKLSGRVLGVDRASDVAILRVDAKADTKLPAPLQFGSTDDLVETQKVYIFGFPFGTELGKNITVSESSVSSLRTNARGELTQVQVNGGMHPGNSGGPVVNTLGHVVGVSVSVIRNTQINFAVPAHTAAALFDGRIVECKAGELFQERAEVRVPLHYPCLDPLQQIKEVRVEVWAGRPAGDRAFSPKEAKPLDGDGPRQTHTLKYAKDAATGDVALPKLAPGQVAWVQPVLVFAKGKPVWGAPRAFDAKLAVERVAAELSAKLSEQKERTVQLKTSQSFTLRAGKEKLALVQSAELSLVESFSPNPKGALVTVGFGAPALSFEEDGKKSRPAADVAALLQRIPPRFVLDETNRLRERADINLNPQLPPALREQVGEYLTQVCNGYESATFVIPNKTLQPRDTWAVKLPLLLKTGAKPELVDLALTCTFEGTRKTADGSEALVTFEGAVQSRAANEKLDGRVAGRFTLDLKRGFISSVQTRIASEMSSPSGAVQASLVFDVHLTRAEGNPGKIALPQSGTRPAPDPKKEPPAGGKPAAKVAFAKPAPSKQPTSYMKVVSEQGDFIGQGKKYDYTGDDLKVQVNARGVTVQVDGWRLSVGGPGREFIQEGEYQGAKRHAFSGDAPGLDFSGKGRGSNELTGAFVVWELEVKDGKVVKLALDFVQHSEGKAPALTGKVRINSGLE